MHYRFVEASEKHDREVVTFMQEIFEKRESHPKKILIDYSCMQKEWVAAILDYIQGIDNNMNSIEVYFSCTPSGYSRPRPFRKPFFRRKTKWNFRPDKNKKPVALIIGLGYESELALHAFREVNTTETYLFYADPTYDKSFVNEVERLNAELIR